MIPEANGIRRDGIKTGATVWAGTQVRRIRDCFDAIDTGSGIKNEGMKLSTIRTTFEKRRNLRVAIVGSEGEQSIDASQEQQLLVPYKRPQITACGVSGKGTAGQGSRCRAIQEAAVSALIVQQLYVEGIEVDEFHIDVVNT